MAIGPEIKEGYVVQLSGVGDDREGTLWYARRKEPFTYETGQGATAEFTAVAAGASSGFQEVQYLKPAQSPPRLYWVSWGVRFGGRYFVQIKAGTQRLGTDLTPTQPWIDPIKSPYYAPDPDYSFWLIHDWTPSFSYTNTTRYSITPRIWFEGQKFDIERIANPALQASLKASNKFSIVTIGGVMAGTVQGV